MTVSGIVLLKEALTDLKEGQQFYDNIYPHAGSYFWDSLISDIESLIIYAGVHRKYSGYYRMLSRRFPYAIYYDIEIDIARVIAVLPLRRNPLWINKQLGKRN